MKRKAISCFVLFVFICGLLVPLTASASVYLPGQPVTSGSIEVYYDFFGGEEQALLWVTDDPAGTRRWNRTLKIYSDFIEVSNPSKSFCSLTQGEKYNLTVVETFTTGFSPRVALYLNGVYVGSATDGNHINTWKFIGVEYFNCRAVYADSADFSPQSLAAKLNTENEYIKITESEKQYDGFAVTTAFPFDVTVGEFLDEVSPSEGASVKILRDGAEAKPDSLLSSGDIAAVTSSSGTVTNHYSVTVRKPSFLKVKCSDDFLKINLNAVLYPDDESGTVKVFKYEEGVVHSCDDTALLTETVATENLCDLETSIDIPDTFESGFYEAYIFYTVDGEQKQMSQKFLYSDLSSAEAENLAKNVNDAKNPDDVREILSSENNLEKLGFEKKDYEQSLNFICETLYGLLKNGAVKPYSVQTLISGFKNANAAYSLKTYGTEASEQLSEYFGEKYEMYSVLTDSEKACFDLLLSSADYGKALLSDIFSEKIMLCRVIAAESRNSLKDYLTDNYKYFGIDISDTGTYSRISAVHRYKVFDGILSEKNSINAKEDVKMLFNKYVKKAYDEEPKKTTEKKSGGSSSSKTYSSSSDVYKPSVPELPSRPTAKAASERLRTLGIMIGFPDGSMKLDTTVSRAEFSKMLVLSFDINANNGTVFKDVSENDWFYEYVGRLSGADVVLGYNGYFKPNDTITREDSAVMLYRLASHKSIALKGEFKAYSDFASVSDYAASAVAVLASENILDNKASSFSPGNHLTRGDAAIMICQMIDKMNGGDKQ